MTLADPLRAIEDRLIRLETRMENLATKTDLAESKTDMVRWYVGLTLVNQATVLVLITGATLVNHFWK